MATRGTQEQDRAAATDAAARGLLHAGNTPAARHGARHELDRVLKALHSTDPARAAQIDAELAGQMLEIAARLPGHKPAGYTGGPPSAAHLIAIYETARRKTGRQQ